MKNKNNIHSFNSLVVDDLSNDDELLETFISTIIEDYHETGDLSAFLTSLKQVVEAKGGMTWLAKKTNLNRQHLYKALSEEGNPTIQSMSKILFPLGFQFYIGRVPQTEHETQL
jgi:probable addiction module antidote protein